MTKYFLRSLYLAAPLFFLGCSKPVVTTFPLTVNIYTGSVSVSEADAPKLWTARETAYNTMNRILFALDSRDPKSDISRVNGIAGSARWPIPSDTFRILDLINHYSTLTGGAIDMTMTPISDLWGIGASEPLEEPPATDLVRATLQGIGQQHVKLSDDGTIAFYSPLIQLDVGSMAAGYAVDLSILILRRQSITNVLLNLGNTSRSLGHSAPGVKWNMPIPDPWMSTQQVGSVDLAGSSALALSRLHEQTITIGDKTYSRILNPKTGMPAEGTALTAVIAPSATMANALAQALLVVGLEKAEEVLRAFPRCEALIIPDRKPLELWATENFGKVFLPATENVSSLRLLAVTRDEIDATGENATNSPTSSPPLDL